MVPVASVWGPAPAFSFPTDTGSAHSQAQGKGDLVKAILAAIATTASLPPTLR